MGIWLDEGGELDPCLAKIFGLWKLVSNICGANAGQRLPSCRVFVQLLFAFLLSFPSFPFFSSSASASCSFLFLMSSDWLGVEAGWGRNEMIMQVMLSHPVPSPVVSGAKHCPKSYRGKRRAR